jgi:hypothetical protein
MIAACIVVGVMTLVSATRVPAAITASGADLARRVSGFSALGEAVSGGGRG